MDNTVPQSAADILSGKKPPQPAAADRTVTVTGAPVPTTPPAPTPVSAALRPPASAPAAPAPAPINPAMAQVAHDSIFGRVAKTLFTGSTTQYQVDPNTGQLTATRVKEPPGQFFRNMVAGAMLGGAAASAETGKMAPGVGGIGGFATGGNAVIQNNQRQDLIRREQAEQQFKDQREAALGNAQIQTESARQAELRAQASLLNAQELHTHQMIAGDAFKLHTDIVNSDKPWADMYAESGIKPVYANLTESQMLPFLKAHPGAVGLQWIATGTKVMMTPDGKTDYENTFEAFDPNQEVALSPKVYAEIKKSGLPEADPELWDTLKPGQKLNPQTALFLRKEIMSVRSQTLKDDSEKRRTDAYVFAQHAEGVRALAEAGVAGLTKNQQQALDKARKDLDKAGGDLTKLPPSERMIIADGAEKYAGELTTSLKAALAANGGTGDKDAVARILPQLQQIQGLQAYAYNTLKVPGSSATTSPQSAPNPEAETQKLQQVFSVIMNLPADDQVSAIDSSEKLNPDEKTKLKQMRDQYRKQPNPVVGAVGSALSGSVLRNVIP